MIDIRLIGPTTPVPFVLAASIKYYEHCSGYKYTDSLLKCFYPGCYLSTYSA